MDAAGALDLDFSELERLSGQIEKAEIDSENGLERVQQLLTRFGECGLRVGDGVQVLAKALDEARVRGETASQAVAARLAEIQRRQQEYAQMRERFGALATMVRELNGAMAALQQQGGRELSPEHKTLLLSRMPEIDSKLDDLVGEASKLKEDAQSVGMKGLVRDADSIRQSLQSARSKLSVFAGQDAN